MNFPNNNNEFDLIRDYGDLLEKEFAEKIEQRIPSYAKIWAKYIGNDGDAHALAMQGAKEGVLESRQKCWQRIYTLFESLASCWDIEEDFLNTKAIDQAKTYVQYLNFWMAFYAHLGRIRDMVDKIANEIKKPELVAPLKKYWEQRHIVLHGPKVPLKCINNVVGVPELGDEPRRWNDKMLWEQLELTNYMQISERVTLILREVEPKLDRFLAEMTKLIPSLYDWEPVNWHEFLKLRTDWEEGKIAGSAGYVWPGGVQPPPSGVR